MTTPRRAALATRTLCSLGLLVAAVLPMQFIPGRSAAAASAHPCLTMAGAGDTPFIRNFNPFGASNDFTLGGIYEPLYIITAAGGGHTYPWLATSYTWRDGNKT